jgi:3-oxoadipate enol-lactonase / 4-carboxymuconolactone decarboxylase
MNFLTINGHVLHYQHVKTNAARTFVFANSLGTDFRIWDGVVERLTPHGSVLRFDKPGHGLSEIPDKPLTISDYVADVIGLMDALDIQKCVFVGLSIGGLIGQQLALAHPDRLYNLVLSNTAPKIGTPASWNDRISTVQTQGIAAILSAVLDRWFPAHFQQTNPAQLTGFRAMLEQTAPVGYVRACEAIRDMDLTADIGRISVPTLCIGGTHDGSTPPDLVRAMADAIPNARFELIAGAGHIPCAQMPDVVADLILSFIKPIGQSLYETGMNTRRAVLGDAHVDRAEGNKTDVDADFQRYITESVWGSIWSRPGISHRDRSLITIALLAALGHDDELAMHLRATRNTGATLEEVTETLLHTAIYAGVPVTNGAMKILKSILP